MIYIMDQLASAVYATREANETLLLPEPKRLVSNFSDGSAVYLDFGVWKRALIPNSVMFSDMVPGFMNGWKL